MQCVILSTISQDHANKADFVKFWFLAQWMSSNNLLRLEQKTQYLQVVLPDLECIQEISED